MGPDIGRTAVRHGYGCLSCKGLVSLERGQSRPLSRRPAGADQPISYGEQLTTTRRDSSPRGPPAPAGRSRAPPAPGPPAPAPVAVPGAPAAPLRSPNPPAIGYPVAVG